MAKAADAFVEFHGDFSQVQAGAATQGKKLESTFKSNFKNIAKGAALSFAAIGGASLLKGAFRQAEESAKVARQTEAVIKSTGGAARVSAGHVESLSNKLSGIAAVDDELIASAENVLLTFTNIRNQAGKGNDIFDQATTSATDLSAALGQDLQSSVIQIGKALNDPIKGITALRRVGVSFTKDQIKQVKSLVDTGKSLDAQKLILGELKKEFGGAAAAAATPTQKLKVAFQDLEESLGKILVPLVNGFVPVMTFLANHPEAAAVVLALAAAFGAMVIVTKIVEAMKGFQEAMVGLNAVMAANPAILVVAAIAALGVAIFVAYKKFKPFHDAVDAAWQILQSTFHWVQQNWPLLLAILTGPIGLAVRFIIQHFDDIKGAISGVKNWIQQKFHEIVSFITGLPGKIGRAAAGMWDGIKDAFKAAINFVIRAWNGLDFKIPGFSVFGKHIGGFTLGLPDIKPLAEGGIVTRPTLALIGERGPEAVVPLSGGTGAVMHIDASIRVAGSVIDFDQLEGFADERDRKLVAAIGAGSR